MTKYISVPISYMLYEVPDDTIQVLSSGVMTQPPQVVLEVMVLNGQAKRLAQIGSIMVGPQGEETEEEDDDDDDAPAGTLWGDGDEG